MEGPRPTPWFQSLLDAGVRYYKNQGAHSAITFVISGRWNNTQEKYEEDESTVGARYIQDLLPDTQVLKETLAVETGGNFAFSKPFIALTKPDKVVIVNAKVKQPRTEYLANKIFGTAYTYEYVWVEDTFSENPRAQAKEPKALAMFKKLFDGITDGDDAAARDILLYKTPFYYWDITDNEAFFNKYWPGGFEDFKEKRLSIDNK